MFNYFSRGMSRSKVKMILYNFDTISNIKRMLSLSQQIYLIDLMFAENKSVVLVGLREKHRCSFLASSFVTCKH